MTSQRRLYNAKTMLDFADITSNIIRRQVKHTPFEFTPQFMNLSMNNESHTESSCRLFLVIVFSFKHIISLKLTYKTYFYTQYK